MSLAAGNHQMCHISTALLCYEDCLLSQRCTIKSFLSNCLIIYQATLNKEVVVCEPTLFSQCPLSPSSIPFFTSLQLHAL